MALYGTTNPDTPRIKAAKGEKTYPLATLALIWFASPAWLLFIGGWVIVLGAWPDFNVGVWWMIGITYLISWISAWICRWYYEDNYATHTGKPLHQVITGW